MGIYDRDYYRREGPSFLGSFVEKGLICKWLIGINLVCFLLDLVSNWELVRWLALDPQAVLQGEIWRLLTYAFLHADPWHIFFNMLLLWWFGNELEDLLGHREFLCFYLVSALLGGIFYVLCNLRQHALVENELSIAAMRPAICIGASGAVTAVMVLFACHYPRRMVLVFFMIPVPIWVLVAFSVGADLWMFTSKTAGLTAVSVHLAGAAFAYLYFRAQLRLTGWLPNLQRWRRRQQAARLRVYQPEEEPRPTPMPVQVPSNATTTFEEEQLEAKMDAVLEKISRVGKENLTDTERQVLLRASEVFRRRRP